MFGFLIALFAVLSLVVAMLGHPKIYRVFFPKRKKSCDTLDHKESFGI